MKRKLPEENKTVAKLKTLIAWAALAGVSFLMWKYIFAVNEDEIGASLKHCIAHCTERGYESSYCSARCGGFRDKYRAPPEEEPGCMADCLRSRRPENFCRKTCTF